MSALCWAEVTYDDDVGESPEEERPAEVLPEAGPVLRVVYPGLQNLEIRALRELVDECLIRTGMRGDSEVQFTLGRHLGWIFGRVIPNFLVVCSWCADGMYNARAEEEPREHGLLECEEEQHEDDCVDDGDDILRPPPADCVGDRSARD